MGIRSVKYIKCDRCSEEYELKDPYLTIDYSMRTGRIDWLHRCQKTIYLCNKCRKDFVKFMRGKLEEDEW